MNNPRKSWLTALVAAICLIVGVAAGWTLGRRSNPGSGQGAMPVLGRAPEYSGLTNQLGRPVSSGDFKGKVQVVAFLFPYCTTYCPLIAAHLVGLENLLKISGLRDRVEIVSFNVDPGGAGPPQMSAFMKEYGWNPSDLHWQYLTGKPQVVRNVVTGGFHVAYARVTDSGGRGEQGPEQTPQPQVVNPLARRMHVNYDVTHNDGLILVDPAGRVRKIYQSADTVSGDRLLRTIKRLAGSASAS